MCSYCGQRCRGRYDKQVCRVGDLSLAGWRISLEYERWRVNCPGCGGVHVEHLDWLANNSRYTQRFATHVGKLCRDMPNKAVAEMERLHHGTVKALDTLYMQEQVDRAGLPAPRAIGVDEISIRKGHNYRVIVSDLERARPIWVGGEGRKETDIDLFFKALGGKKSARIKLAAMDMWKPFRNSVIHCLGAQLAISVHNCPVLTDSRFPMSIFKRTQRKYVKKAYRVRNWRDYEAGLRNRGSLTVWISLTAGKLVNWDAPRPRRRKPGRQRKYSNHAIGTAVTLGMVFHLSSRQSEGLLRSLFALMKLDNDVPDHTTISRRKAKLGKVPFYQDKQKTPLHILIDSSGLAVHAGQLRRAPKSRDYRKLHLCVDEQTGEVVAGELTSKRARDSSRVASLVGQIDSPISSARADTAYDASGVYEAIENHSAHRSPRVLIPSRKGAQLASGPASSRQRNRNIAAQARLGKRKWHTESGYSKRSKVETTFHRYKAIVGSAMRARGLAAQRVEARIGCKILNTMTALGMPDSEMIG